jgi:hypothetical protein
MCAGGGADAWGYNQRGQLGDGTTTSRHLPAAVSGLDSVASPSSLGTMLSPQDVSSDMHTRRPRHRALVAVLLAPLATTSACASSAVGPPTGTTITTPTTTTPVETSARTTSASPVTSAPAADTAKIPLSGSVPAQLVSAEGPTTDGVVAGHSVAALLHGMQRAGHGFLSCAPAQCWQGRQLPAHTIGVAFQANPLGCEQVDSVHVSSPHPGRIRFAVQAHPVCTRGGGAAAKGMTILIAVPRSALPRSGALTAQVDLAMRPGDAFKFVGTASTPL